MTLRQAQGPAALLVRHARIVDPAQGLDEVGDLWLESGQVRGIVLAGRLLGMLPPAGIPTLDAGGLMVAPGFIDLHCHLREPGFEEKETIATGTRAAARGGFTTICAMPNTRPAMDSAATVEFVREKARMDGLVRVLPIGAVTKGQVGEELAEMGELAEAGVVGFSDDGRPVASSRLMRHALEYSRLFGLPVIDHCEDLSLAHGGAMNEGAVSARLGLRGMPAAAEEIVVARDLVLLALTGGRLHIAHVSTRGSVELVRRAKAQGLPVTAEVTPHHLTLTEDWVLGPPEGRGRGLSSVAYDTNAKVNPPLRTQADIEALLEGLRDGTIDAIATDHAPHDLVSKQCEFGEAAFGISGLETALGALLGLVQAGRLDLSLLIAKLTAEPARLLGKPWGTLQVGTAADIVIIDPEAEWVVDPAQFASLGKNTPLAGQRLRGRVVGTLYGGRVIYQVPKIE